MQIVCWNLKLYISVTFPCDAQVAGVLEHVLRSEDLGYLWVSVAAFETECYLTLSGKIN
jgi:hypothetical protein